MTQAISTKTGKIPQFAYVRILACFGVVLLHTLFASSLALEPSGSAPFAAQAWQNNLMWGVPCFLMTTGALLLNPEKNISLHKIYTKYVKRITITLVVFTLVFAALDPLMEGSKFSFSSVVGNWIRNVVTDGSWAHMWYLYLLIGIYAMLPVYRAIIRSCSDREIQYICAIFVLFVSVLPMTELFDFKIGFYLCTTIIYPLYPILGYAIFNGKIKFSRLTSAIILIGCTVSIVLLTYFRINYADICFDVDALGVFDELFGYASVFVIGQGVCIYSLLCGLKCDSRGILKDEGKHACREIHSSLNNVDGMPDSTSERKSLYTIDKCTFGAYLIHMIFLKYVLICKHVNPLVYTGVKMVCCVLLMAIVFFIVSLIVTWVLRKIPGIKSFL